MRLLYHHIVQNISKNDCRIIINDLKGRVATSFMIEEWESKKDAVFRYITTSRPVENWLQDVDDSVYKMVHEKIPPKLWMVTGGYGAGKSHMKEFLKRNEVENIKYLEPKISSLLPPDRYKVSIYDVFSLILLETKRFINPIYEARKKELHFTSKGEIDKDIRKILTDNSIDDDFVDAFCAYARSDKGNQRDLHILDELIINKGEQLFLPLMKIFKKYIDIKGICILVDEFEGLQFLDSKRQMRFIESIRALYDTVASTISNPDLPSFQMIILCTLSYWNDLIRNSRSQALRTRVSLFEIPPLVEDEIIALAEKLYVIHKKSEYPAPEIRLDFNKLPAYVIHRAGIESPLTARFVISEIINLIEEPNDYDKFVP